MFDKMFRESAEDCNYTECWEMQVYRTWVSLTWSQVNSK